MAALLISNVSIINSADMNGWTALHWAVAVNSPVCTQHLLSQPVVEAHLLTKQRESVFHLAARRGSIQMLQMLLDHYGGQRVINAILATRPSLRELLNVTTLYDETATHIARGLTDSSAAVYLETVLAGLGQEGRRIQWVPSRTCTEWGEFCSYRFFFYSPSRKLRRQACDIGKPATEQHR